MATTWKQIKLATLQKMFASEGTDISSDESIQEYIYAMPFACNEALQMLSTAGKFLIHSVSIAHFPVPNLITDSEAKKIHTIYNGEQFVLEDDGIRSATLEVMGEGMLSIYLNGNIYTTETIANPTGFIEKKYLINNPSGAKVRLVFVANGQLAIKSIGLYTCSFSDVKDIPAYKTYLRYPMKEYAPDFYQLESNQIYYEGEGDEEYLQTSEFFQEGNKVLVLPRSKTGNYTIYYKAYPEQITSNTEDEYELPIDDEVVALIPLYMASQLYKDDDMSIATTYRNEFEVGFERLSQKANVPVAEFFKSESGWI